MEIKEDHSTHDSKIHPIKGCQQCDIELGKPIPLCFGGGKSTQVILIPKKKEE